MRQTLEKILLQSPVFAFCDPSGIEHLAGLGRLEAFNTPSLLAPEGTTPDVIRFIVKGRVDLLRVTENGLAARIPIVTGSWATWLGCLYNQPIDHELWSSANAEYAAFPVGPVRALVKDNTRALNAVIAQVGATLRLMIGWSHAQALYNKEQQLVYVLMAISEKDASGEGCMPLTITHEHLGQIGVGTRQLVGRLLTILEKNGLVELGYGSIRLRSLSAAQAFVAT